jgi:epoxide hydrolase-like predicted phosphatase
VARDGLLIDFGGVLTTNVFESFAAFCRDEGLEQDSVRDLFMQNEAARAALDDLETGRATEAEFEARFAPLVGLATGEGLIARMFARMHPDERMFEGVAAAKRAGIRTGLVSNSWGEEGYDRTRFAELFDVLVISGEIGIRKPAPEIYSLAAERLGRAPERCVFVDDLPGNLKPARAIGMATVLHRDAETTLAELEGHLGVGLR